MPLSKYVKDPDERKRYQIDYSEWLDTGEQATNVAFAVSPVTVPPLVVDDIAVTPSGLGVQYYVSGGLDGKTYTITATLTTTVGPQIREDDILMVVRERQ